MTESDEPIVIDDSPLPATPAPRLTPSGNRSRVDLKLDRKLVARIDEARGGATRTAWIERACKERLEPKPKAAAPPAAPPVPNAEPDCPHPYVTHYAWGSICSICGAKL